MNTPPTSPITAGVLVLRVAASTLGTYAFCWGLTTLSMSSLVALGMDFDEAYTLVMLLVFLVFLAAFCWAIAARSLRRVWLVLAGGGGAMTLAAWLLTRSLV